MCAVGVEESSAVRAPLFDDLLRGDWPLGNALISDGVDHRLAGCIHHGLTISVYYLYLLWFDELHGVVRLQVLRNSLPDQQKRPHYTKRKQYPKRAANEIDPKISDRFLFPAHNAANERNGQHNSDCRRDEVVVCEPRHLGEVAHRCLASVVLPIGV